MGKKAGVWIDHKQAIVVLVTDKGKEIKKITSNVGMLAIALFLRSVVTVSL
jgi:hypothetical protein